MSFFTGYVTASIIANSNNQRRNNYQKEELESKNKKLMQKIHELEEQLKEAQNLIIYCSSGDHLGYEIRCENYMHKYKLSKWGVK